MKNNFLLLIFVFFAISLHAQDTLVVDAAHCLIRNFTWPLILRTTNNIIIATMHGGTTGDMKVYYTLDQGASWQTSPFTGVHPGYQGAGDPVLDFDASGNAYLVNLSLFGGIQYAVISKSTDGGATWQLETTIFLIPPDKPWLAVDRSTVLPTKATFYLPFVNVFEGPVLAYV
jgi:Neuraminidase (sialidase)